MYKQYKEYIQRDNVYSTKIVFLVLNNTILSTMVLQKIILLCYCQPLVSATAWSRAFASYFKLDIAGFFMCSLQ